jgi:RHS repeat-associated protein
MAAVLNSSGATVRAEVNVPGRHVGTYANSTTYFSFNDWLGTERVRTGPNTTVVETCQGATFGDMQSCTNTDVSPLHFTGLERDPESNLDHTWFRQYSSSLGRWASPDPAGLAAVDPSSPQSWNRYAYVGNNPLAFTDPLGLDPGSCDSPDNGACGGACPDGGILCSPTPSDCNSPNVVCVTATPLPPATPDQCAYVLCTGAGGGGAGGPIAGFPATSTLGGPPRQPARPPFWQCFNYMADQTSLQQTLHAGNGFLASTFLSNTPGTVAQALHDAMQGNLWSALKNTWSAFSSNAVTAATKYVPNPVAITPVATIQASATLTVQGALVAESTTSVTVVRVAPMLPLGTLVQSAANGINYFNIPKLTYDGVATIGSALACTP